MFAGVPSYPKPHTYGMTSVNRDFGGRDHGFEAHGLGRALSEDGGSEESCVVVCCHKGSRVVRQKLRLLEESPVTIGESFPAKQEAVLESWLAGRHWCPGTSTRPLTAAAAGGASRNPVFSQLTF